MFLLLMEKDSMPCEISLFGPLPDAGPDNLVGETGKNYEVQVAIA